MSTADYLVWTLVVIITAGLAYELGRWHQYLIQLKRDAFGGPE